MLCFMCCYIFFFVVFLTYIFIFFFFFQAEDGIRDADVTGVQTCALPIYVNNPQFRTPEVVEQIKIFKAFEKVKCFGLVGLLSFLYRKGEARMKNNLYKIGRASCRERV